MWSSKPTGSISLANASENEWLPVYLQYLFVGNCGLDNNISYDYLEETFGAFGQVIDIIMPAKKSYAFVIFEEPLATEKAIASLQSKVITSNQTPICFYLFPVDRGSLLTDTNCFSSWLNRRSLTV